MKYLLDSQNVAIARFHQISKPAGTLLRTIVCLSFSFQICHRGRCSDLPRLHPVIGGAHSKQFEADQKEAGSPARRLRLIRSLEQVILDARLRARDIDSFLSGLGRLENLEAVEALPSIFKCLNVQGPPLTGEPSLLAMYPARRVLLRIARKDPSEVLQLLYKNVSSSTSSAADTEGQVFVIGIMLRVSSNVELIRSMHQFAKEYDAQALRLRNLALATPSVFVSRGEEGPSRTTTAFVSEPGVDNLEAWDTIFSSEAIARDDKLKASDEAVVVDAIGTLGKLHSLHSVGLLVDKLDWQWTPLKPEKDGSIFISPMMAHPVGLRSPAIAKAANLALRAVGVEALPLIIDALVLRGHTSDLYRQISPLLVELAGSNDAARLYLEQQADDREHRAKRLRAIAATFKDIN